jgi:hypothetical protein
VLRLDLDRFNAVNDTLGGDEFTGANRRGGSEKTPKHSLMR